jgi:hypothetical protein
MGLTAVDDVHITVPTTTTGGLPPTPAVAAVANLGVGIEEAKGLLVDCVEVVGADTGVVVADVDSRGEREDLDLADFSGSGEKEELIDMSLNTSTFCLISEAWATFAFCCCCCLYLKTAANKATTNKTATIVPIVLDALDGVPLESVLTLSSIT